MANGQIEIHDPFINQQDLTRDEDEDAASSSDTEDMEDTPEFRLLMAYAKRRRGDRESHGQNGNRAPPPSRPMISPETRDEEKPKKKNKKKKNKKGWKRILRCIQPQTRDEEPEQASNPEPELMDRCGSMDSEPEETENFDKAAECLTRIADGIAFVPPEPNSPNIEADSPEDNLERMIGLLLREKGDELNERELKALSLDKDFFWSYDFFKTIMTTLFRRMGFRSSDPDSPGPQASPKANMALALEATHRLAAVKTLPSQRINNYGAKYVKENHSSWAQEHGGYEEAFEHDDEEED